MSPNDSSRPVVEYQAGLCSLSGSLDFDTANDVLAEVATLIQSHPHLEISLENITHANSAGLALMIEWLAIAKHEGHTVTFHQIPNSLHQLASVCQVDSLIY